jgi:hypothetical protein
MIGIRSQAWLILDLGLIESNDPIAGPTEIAMTSGSVYKFRNFPTPVALAAV